MLLPNTCRLGAYNPKLLVASGAVTDHAKKRIEKESTPSQSTEYCLFQLALSMKVTVDCVVLLMAYTP